MSRVLAVAVFLFVAGACTSAARGAVVFGQLDDFQNGTTMAWEEGGPSPNPPTNVATGGPRGDGDRFLQNISSGIGSPGSRMVMFNFVQWTGDFAAARVTRVDACVANFGPSDMTLRVALRSPGGTVYATSDADAVALPANAPWRRVSFDLVGDAMALADGAQPLAEVLADVQAMRILSSGGPDWEGERLATTLGVDDLRALRLPGDANFDGRVNASDLRDVRRNLGSATAAGADGWRAGDFDFNGRVDGRDVALLRRHLGESVPESASSPATASAFAAVPEPSAAATALTVVAMALLRRRRA